MRQLLYTLLFVALNATMIAQTVPQGINYQAVARDLDGMILADKPIGIQFSLYFNDRDSEEKVLTYEENHFVTTNQLGLFSVVIGEGALTQGDFREIPWSGEDIWIEVSIDSNGGENFITLSNTQLLSVPYAMHSLTAGSLSGDGDRGPQGSNANNWHTFGNANTDPSEDFLGTSDCADLIIITNYVERIRVSCEGDVAITSDEQSTDCDNGALVVAGGVGIGKNLNVEEKVHVKDATHSTSPEEGALTIEGGVGIGDNLNVAGGTITNTLIVSTEDDPDPLPRMGSIADVRGLFVADSILLDGGLEVGGNLKVYGDSVIIDNDLYVHGTTNLEGKLNLTSNDTGFVACFSNTDGGNGDGIKIKLGRLATKNQGDVYGPIDDALGVYVLDGFGPSQASSIQSLFDGSIDGDDGVFLLSMMTPDADQAIGLAATMCVLTEEIMNAIFMEIDTLFEDSPVPYLGTVDLGCENIGMAWEFPVLEFGDQANTLDGENAFIEFTDDSDWRMGAIKAQSIDEWAGQYLSAVFLYDLYSTFKGLDKSKILPEVRKITKEIAESYLKIGVEYSSGNGDYAEWLERIDHDEFVSAGDIVGVYGGKITKDLRNAEQVMAVSAKPIVLGNIPEKGMEKFGNNVAFMGQIPVKIMGPVNSGDYIVGTTDIPGYGIAVNPMDMTVDNFKYAVGRSWDSSDSPGPKLVNTVIGIHNGDYLNILNRYEQKFTESEARINATEARLKALETTLESIVTGNESRAQK